MMAPVVLTRLRPASAVPRFLASVAVATALAVQAAPLSAAPRQATAAQSNAAPPRARTTLDLNAIIPLDPAVHTGVLPNGLRYYVRANPRPAKRVALRLAVKAGSLDEADEDRKSTRLNSSH